MENQPILDQPEQPDKNKQSKKLVNLLYPIGAVSIIIGALFRIQHWPGSALLLWGGIGLFALYMVLHKRFGK